MLSLSKKSALAIACAALLSSGASAWGEKKNYGKTYEGLVRSTVVVGPEGEVELAQYNVRAAGHVAKLRRDLGLEG